MRYMLPAAEAGIKLLIIVLLMVLVPAVGARH
jgi:hypothetical protein